MAVELCEVHRDASFLVLSHDKGRHQADGSLPAGSMIP